MGKVKRKSRIIFYGENDLSIGDHFQRSISLLKSFDVSNNCADINEAIELYNAYMILCSSNLNPERVLEFVPLQKDILAKSLRFINAIDDERMLAVFETIESEYYESFWSIFEKYCLYERISGGCFEKLIKNISCDIYQVIRNKSIVRKYDTIITGL